MSVTVTQGGSANLNGTGTLQGTVEDVGATALTINTSVPASTANQLLTLSFSHTTLQAIFLLSNQNLTVKTNSSGSPAQIINLLAGIPYQWSLSAGYFSNPITTAVTAFYLTTPGPAATLRGYVLNP